MSFVIVDIETTGLSRERHAITEIAAARYKDGQIVETYQTLVNPQSHIPSFITRLTGISDDMVRDAPTVDQVIPQFLEFLGDDTFVGHNAAFDYGFLSHNARMCNLSLTNNVLCTVKLANRLIPELSSKKLGSLCTHFSIINDQAHRALSDVLATVEVFRIMLSHLEKHEMHELPHLIKLSNMPKARIPVHLCLP